MENNLNLSSYEEITELEWNTTAKNYETEAEGDYIKISSKQDTKYFRKKKVYPIVLEDRYGNVFTITKQNLWLRQHLTKEDSEYEYDSPVDLEVLKDFIKEAEETKKIE
jgi:hypothetical protein